MKPLSVIDLAAISDVRMERRADVCVVGSGVAGQTLARRLSAKGLSVLIAESGGTDFNAAVQDLADGPNVGFEYYPLRDSRLRLYGGTTAIWGGRAAALDRIDFEKRDWVPHSGWPIGYDDLDPYVDEAFAALDLHRPRDWASVGAEHPGFDPAKIDLRLWAFDDRAERFTDPRDLSLPRVEVMLNATLTEIDIEDSGAVASMRFTSLNGREMMVQAKHYVLAAGGIETPRLLLATAPKRPLGLGNDHDLVGRFFMEHPHARGGRVTPLTETLAAYETLIGLRYHRIEREGGRYAATYRPAEAAQRELGLLNSCVTLSIRPHEGQSMSSQRRLIGELKHGLPAKRVLRGVYRQYRRMRRWLKAPKEKQSVVSKLMAKTDSKGFYAVVRAEQAPNPASRVILTGERDALGLRRAALDWRLSPIDRESITGLITLLDQEFRRLGIASATPASWLAEPGVEWQVDPLISNHPIGGYHHMGTTRMAANAHEGVVDGNCRVHGAPNLYIAGSSVFPTSGWANPTVTIIALTLRLADHLARPDTRI